MMEIQINGKKFDLFKYEETDSAYANTLRNVLCALVNLKNQAHDLPDERIWFYWKTIMKSHIELVGLYFFEERQKSLQGEADGR